MCAIRSKLISLAVCKMPNRYKALRRSSSLGGTGAASQPTLSNISPTSVGNAKEGNANSGVSFLAGEGVLALGAAGVPRSVAV